MRLRFKNSPLLTSFHYTNYFNLKSNKSYRIYYSLNTHTYIHITNTHINLPKSMADLASINDMQVTY
ncbi:hypothetical protein HanXRQr2_Chr11g0514641 [Helianthus annuus]|uniref:Uncharacterized protein n=1 Tax=Helianthus annuus TaxID=4232 RepID=A0A9K3N2G0_HELAN|nr:hypothetical protein HanXRQr2_Chr11g0514641 [Helianthus annuus]